MPHSQGNATIPPVSLGQGLNTEDRMKRISVFASLTALCIAAAAAFPLAATPAAAQGEELYSAHVEGTPPAPKPGPIWNLTRFIGDKLAFQMETVFLQEVVSHSHPGNVVGYSLNFHLEMYFVPTPIRKSEETPTFPPGEKWFTVFRPGVGTLYIKQTAENESWLIKSDDFEVLADRPVDPNAVSSFSWTSTLLDGSRYLGSGEVQVGVGGWALMGINGVYHIAFMPPGSYPECAPPEFAGHVWVKVPIPDELGAFYGLATVPGQIWTVTIGDGTYSASAVETDPNPPAFEVPPPADGECSSCCSK